MLRTVQDEHTLTRAQGHLRRSVEAASTTKVTRSLGWQGGGREVDVWWLPSLELWVGLGDESNRYWNALGLGDPNDNQNLSIVVEINPPKSGLNRRISGAILEDEDGALYLAHRGKVGGGRSGVGKSAFMESYGGLTVPVADGDRKSDMVVLGALDDPHLIVHIAKFVRDVDRFKRGVDDGKTGRGIARRDGEDTYSREFAGVTEVSPTKNTITARVTHGHIVEALHAELKRLDVESFNDTHRDLYCRDLGGHPALFEIKTSTDSQSLYTAIGQLFYHAGPMNAKRLIAVLPEPVSRQVRERLSELGLQVLGFTWVNDYPKFELDGLLEDEDVG